MTINEFIEYTKKHELEWINYCEIIIDNNGDVILARPSHTEALISYMMNKENMTRDEVSNSIGLSYSPLNYIIDRYKLVSIWYDLVITSDIVNESQLNSLNILLKERLISSKFKNYVTCEYRLSISRSINCQSI